MNRTRTMIGKSLAVVFYGGGRRWFSLDAACKAQANQRLKLCYEERGDDSYDIPSDEFIKRRNRLASLYKSSFERKDQ